jgi:hypothetical protein
MAISQPAQRQVSGFQRRENSKQGGGPHPTLDLLVLLREDARALKLTGSGEKR